MRKCDYIAIAGFGWSGSSAIVDLLKEVKDVWDPDIEFRVIKDPYGLDDLYRNLVKNWDSLNSDIAIRDFLWLMKHLYQKNSWFSLEKGLNYKAFFGESFIHAVDRFIGKLVDFDYIGDWWFIDWKKSKETILAEKIKHRIIRSKSEEKRMYFARPLEDDFIQAAQQMIDEIFVGLAEKNNAHRIVLDQAIDPKKFMIEKNFFGSCKLIVVDRDPRDIYTDLLQGGYLIGGELALSHDVNKYINWHNALRNGVEDIYSTDNVLFIQFEDLVLHYSATVETIFSFLGINKKMHIAPQKFFNPNESEKNVGIWKGLLSQEEHEDIENALSRYLYNN